MRIPPTPNARQAEAQDLRSEMQQLRQEEERRLEAVAAKEQAVENWEAGRLKEPSWDLGWNRDGIWYNNGRLMAKSCGGFLNRANPQ